MLQIKRAYEPPEKKDGFRILVDRLWPRGLSKAKAAIDLWLKEIAPSDALRKWYSHDPKKWKEFQNRYRKELRTRKELLEQIKKLEKEHKTITFLFSSNEEQYNNAVALKIFLATCSQNRR